MRFLKKTICLNIPVPAAVVVLLLVIILIAVSMFGESNLLTNLRLTTLEAEDISYVGIFYGQGSQLAEVADEQMIEEIISAVKDVHLSGKPYKLSIFGGGSGWYRIEMKNGQVMNIGGVQTHDYFYVLNGDYYFICKDEMAEQSEDLTVWKRIEELHKKQVNTLLPGI